MPSAVSTTQFRGYAIHDTKNWTSFKLIDFEPKPFEDYDIDIKIEYCGVCGSDVHTITGGWGKPALPIVPGHEIVGKAVRVGSMVSSIKVGDRVGVGAQICSCMNCAHCKNDDEQYCPKRIYTYNSRYHNAERTLSQGGYSTAVRAHEQFVFPIPDEMPLEEAAPMLCAGLTVYSPLVRNGAGKGKKVGIVGVGGLGHFAIQFAKALECDDVVVFSHSPKKRDDAMTLGATDVVFTCKDGFEEPLVGQLDLIICTANVSDSALLRGLMSTLKIHGRLIMVAMPDESLPSLMSTDLAMNGALLGGSLIGSKKEALSMLDLAVRKGVKPWIDVVPMKDCGKAVRAVKDGKIRYRRVLKMDIE
ncbi:NADPH-dependent alcohol dehydrogenase [Collybia nuda]|uniref:NADPH-dependent alcohol dehydrogenase n=1 Tax=Collybia nuda TaxID=64659 RepID=A0A9P5Y7B0_9AGAR|nr:NADPH-dependent alcohol dehydrogenase [Collybia nuda]